MRRTAQKLEPRLTRKWRVNPDHTYNLAPGAVVQSARFKSQVDVWQEAEPGPIWRGNPSVEVGRTSLRLWRFVVHGALSGVATSEEAAKAQGESWANKGRAEPSATESAAFAAYLKDIDDRFPTAERTPTDG